MIQGYIEGQSLRIETPIVVSDTINYLTANFTFSDDWNECIKYAHFVKDDIHIPIQLTDNKILEKDELNLSAGVWLIHIHGEIKDENNVVLKRITTDSQHIPVMQSGVEEGDPLPLTPKGEAEQLWGAVGELEKDVKELAEKGGAVKSVNQKTGEVFLTASDVGALPEDTKIPYKTSELDNDAGFLKEFTESDPTVPSWAKQKNKPAYTASEVGADAAGTAVSKISEHNTDNGAHGDLRLLVQELANRLNALADSDDVTLDQMSEVVAFIKSNKTLLYEVTTNKINYTDIIDNLATNVKDRPLSAAMGVVLKSLIDALTVSKADIVDGKVPKSQLPDDIGVQSDWNENDETSPAHIKNRICYETRTHSDILWDGNTEGLLIYTTEDQSCSYCRVSEVIDIGSAELCYVANVEFDSNEATIGDFVDTNSGERAAQMLYAGGSPMALALSVYKAGYEDNGIVFEEPGLYLAYLDMGDVQMYVEKITFKGEVVTIPIKFIPKLDYIALSMRGVMNGVATLDGNVKVPLSQLPTESTVYNGATGIATAQAVYDYVQNSGITAFSYKGTKDYYSDLPTSDNKIGDVWNIIYADETNGVDAGDNACWNGNGWDILSGVVDLSDYSTTEQIVAMLNNYAKKSDIPTNVSAFENDAGYIKDYTESDPTVPSWAKQKNKPAYTASEVGADAAGTAESKTSEHNTSVAAHNDIRIALEALRTKLEAFLDTDDTTLDQASEIIAYIKSNKSLIDSITSSKVNVSDIVNDLVTNVINKPLSAAQGVVLKSLYDSLSQSLSGYVKTESLAKVATTNAYSDLDDLPIIPQAYTHPSSHPASMITGLDDCATSGNAKKWCGYELEVLSKSKFATTGSKKGVLTIVLPDE